MNALEQRWLGPPSNGGYWLAFQFLLDPGGVTTRLNYSATLIRRFTTETTAPSRARLTETFGSVEILFFRYIID